MKTILVCGSSGFIASHLIRYLNESGYRVCCVSRDTDRPDLSDYFWHCDLTDYEGVRHVLTRFTYDEIYQLAAEVGGLGYITDTANDAKIMRTNSLININVVEACREAGFKGKLFYASSACVYPDLLPYESRAMYEGVYYEGAAYPANCSNAFGWAALYCERLYQAYAEAYGLDVRIARFANTFGPGCPFLDPYAKAPAALCRKVAELPPGGGTIEIWGDGTQIRSFLYVDDCVEGIVRLMNSDLKEPVNLSSAESITLSNLAFKISKIASKSVHLSYAFDKPVGAKGRISDISLLRKHLNWEPQTSLGEGLEKTYRWVEQQVRGLTAAAG